MGFLSKLLSGESKKILGDIIDSVQAGVENSATGQSSGNQYADESQTEAGGKSWGRKMPAEENQYNFSGRYYEYFDSIYKAEFPEYEISYEMTYDGRATEFTFVKDGRKALVVELLSETSAVKRRKMECAKEGIPYLRFYYNHKGWWNTRSYVIERTKNALNG